MSQKDPQSPLEGGPVQVHVGIGRRLTNYFLTGLVIAGPIGITLYIAWWVIGFVDDFVKPLIPSQYNPDSYLPVHVPGFGLAVAAVAMAIGTPISMAMTVEMPHR